jgi:nitroreductase
MPETNETIRLLKRIRQVRNFEEKPVPEDALNDILDVARWTGSGGNRQPWVFIVVDDPETLSKLASIGRSAPFFANAPLVIAIAVNHQTSFPGFDEARVAERIFTAAAAHGLGSGIGTYTVDSMPEVATLLNLPEDYAVHVGVAIGYPDRSAPASTTKNRGRKPLSDLVHYGRFGTQHR